MSNWTALWLLWGAMFALVEAPAVWRKARGDTLSEQVWWLRDRKVGPVPIGYLILGPFWLWLTLHLFVG